MVVGARLISYAVNKENAAPKSYIKPHRLNFAAHAEIEALHNLDKETVNGGTIYIYGITTAGRTMQSCRPCTTCWSHILSMGLKKVVYNEGSEVREINLCQTV